jgi:hypothetical protein
MYTKMAMTTELYLDRELAPKENGKKRGSCCGICETLYPNADYSSNRVKIKAVLMKTRTAWYLSTYGHCDSAHCRAPQLKT